MIQTDKFLFVENPRTGTTAVGNVLIEEAGGFMLTPRHGSIKDGNYERDAEFKATGRTIFCTVRDPLARMQSLYHYTKGDYPSVLGYGYQGSPHGFSNHRHTIQNTVTTYYDLRPYTRTSRS